MEYIPPEKVEKESLTTNGSPPKFNPTNTEEMAIVFSNKGKWGLM